MIMIGVRNDRDQKSQCAWEFVLHKPQRFWLPLMAMYDMVTPLDL